jgi:hypothetical protein
MQIHWFFRFLGVILLLVGIVAIAGVAYNAGLTQAQGTVPAETAAVYPHAFGWAPMHWMAVLPFLLCLVPFFLGFFIFLPLRMIFGPRRHPWHMHMHGRWHGEEGEIPEPVRKFHARLHENDNQGKPS